MGRKKDNNDDNHSSDLEKKIKDLEKKVERPTQITRSERLERLQDKLEGTHKIKRLKRLEKIALIPQIMIILFLFFLFIYLQGGSLEPFYIPLYTSTIILGLWMIVLAIEMLVFKLVEIKHGKSKSSTFLIAKKSIRKAVQMAVIFILIFTFLFIPFFTERVSEFSSIEKEIDLKKGEPKTIEFTTRGEFNFLVTRNITVEIVPYGQNNLLKDATVTVRLYKKSDYEEGNKNLTINSKQGDPVSAELDDKFHYQYSDREFEENILYLEADRDLTVQYEVERVMPKNKNLYFSTISISMAVIFIGWIFSLKTVKKEQTKESIYH